MQYHESEAEYHTQTDGYVSRTLYVCRLPPNADEDQIRAMCLPFGEVRKTAYYPSKGIAFVEYWDIRGAERARNGLRNATMGGQPVDVQYSKARNDRRDHTPKNTGTLYVRAVALDRDPAVADSISNDAYVELFSRFGEVKKVNPNRKRESEKFIEFFDLRAAEAALTLNGFNWMGCALEIQMANH
ncbi:MAG: hypothetical protein KVP17_004285, partial [Porospora cf. gigantea B]